MASWNRGDIPSQVGKFAVVTGTGGLGYETALALAAAGAEVFLAGRNANKGNASLRSIRQEVPTALIQFNELDLASLASIEAFCNLLLKRGRRIDLLINNAGVMTPPTRKTTQDGFELQFGTNYLGHFALTGRLLPLLNGHHARVVTVSSLAHRLGGAIYFDDLQWTRKYNPAAAYSQSKLANLIFAFELQRLSDANGWRLMSNGAHPGASTTDLLANSGGSDTLLRRLKQKLVELIGHSPAAGALPILFAATSPDANAMGYYGPSGLFELKGAVGPAIVSPRVTDIPLARRLWAVSEELTDVHWPISN
jgi:NAD(P)-dependent dehydrogenase (short-subunit alcohol dehydrogenase family)